MQKNSIVKNVQGNGTWEGKFGLMYKYEVEMETEIWASILLNQKIKINLL